MITDGEINDNLNENNNVLDGNVENTSFYLSTYDTLFVLTRNNSVFKENVANVVSKMIIINEERDINLDNLSETLGRIGIETLNIFSISNSDIETSLFTTDKGSYIRYVDINKERFIEFINHEDQNFLNYNKNSLYILRGGNFLDIKNTFSSINNCQINVGRGGSQKAHIISPLDLRLSTYLLAMFSFDFNFINSLNTFNTLSKDRYLSWKDNSIKGINNKD